MSRRQSDLSFVDDLIQPSSRRQAGAICLLAGDAIKRATLQRLLAELSERVYAPLTAGLLSPVAADARIPDQKRSQLDRLYHRVIDDLDALVQAVGLKTAA